jgi:hypothetical protein
VDGCDKTLSVQCQPGYKITVNEDALSVNQWVKKRSYLWEVTITKSAHYIITEDIVNKTMYISTNQTE